MLLAEQRSLTQPVDDTVKVNIPKKRRRNFKPLVRITGFLLCLMIANLWVQVMVLRQDRQLRVCQAQVRELERRSIKVRLEMAQLESFDRIQTVAQKELGMRVAGSSDYRCIAAAPNMKKNPPQLYDYSTRPESKGNLWAKLSSWLEGAGETMAQNP